MTVASAGMMPGTPVTAGLETSGRFASAAGASFDGDLPVDFAGKLGRGPVGSLALAAAARFAVEESPAAVVDAVVEMLGAFAADAGFTTVGACATARCPRREGAGTARGPSTGEAGSEGTWPRVRSGTGSEKEPRPPSTEVDARAAPSAVGDGATAVPSTGSVLRVGRTSGVEAVASVGTGDTFARPRPADTGADTEVDGAATGVALPPAVSGAVVGRS